MKVDSAEIEAVINHLKVQARAKLRSAKAYEGKGTTVLVESALTNSAMCHINAADELEALLKKQETNCGTA